MRIHRKTLEERVFTVRSHPVPQDRLAVLEKLHVEPRLVVRVVRPADIDLVDSRDRHRDIRRRRDRIAGGDQHDDVAAQGPHIALRRPDPEAIDRPRFRGLEGDDRPGATLDLLIEEPPRTAALGPPHHVTVRVRRVVSPGEARCAALQPHPHITRRRRIQPQVVAGLRDRVDGLLKQPLVVPLVRDPENRAVGPEPRSREERLDLAHVAHRRAQARHDVHVRVAEGVRPEQVVRGGAGVARVVVSTQIVADFVNERDGVVRASMRVVRGPGAGPPVNTPGRRGARPQSGAAAGAQHQGALAREEMHEVRPVLATQVQQVTILVRRLHQGSGSVQQMHARVPPRPIQGRRRLRDMHEVRLDLDPVVPEHHLHVVHGVTDRRVRSAPTRPVLGSRRRVRNQDVQPVVALRVAHAPGRVRRKGPRRGVGMRVVAVFRTRAHAAPVLQSWTGERRHAAEAVTLRVNLVRTAAGRGEPAHQPAALHRQHHRVVPRAGLTARPHQVAAATVLEHAPFRRQDAALGRRHFQPHRRSPQQGQIHLHGGRHRPDRRAEVVRRCRLSDARRQGQEPLRLRRRGRRQECRHRDAHQRRAATAGTKRGEGDHRQAFLVTPNLLSNETWA